MFTMRVAPARESIILATDQPRSCRALAVELLASMPGFAPIPYSPESAAKLARYVADLLTGRWEPKASQVLTGWDSPQRGAQTVDITAHS